MDARILQEAIRSATVTYPIPFVFGVLLLFAVLCLGGSLITTDWLRILFAALGVVSALSAIAFVAFAITFRPETLRSEQHVLSMRMAQMIGDKDMDPALRERLSHLVVDADDRPRAKSAEPPASHAGRASEDTSDG
jgi:Na+(H+)/acetate symporter ActP